MNDFLEIPKRDVKPRSRGLTFVLDTGLSTVEVESLLGVAGDLIDMVKLGWGTGYVTQNVEKKVSLYQERSVPVILGGTLGEIAEAQGQIDRLVDWVKELGLSHIEISDGTLDMERSRKLELIERLSDDLTVLSEVGSKDPDALVAPFRWVEEIKEDLNAGAAHVILESRESGTAGVYRPSGEVRMGLIEEIEHEIDHNKLVFEAPRKAQQTWFINHFGTHVNLGNIAPSEVIPLETLRLGLRADTVELSVGPGDSKQAVKEL